MLSNDTLLSQMDSNDCFVRLNEKRSPAEHKYCNKVEYIHRVVGIRQKLNSKSISKKKLEAISSTPLQDNYQTLFESYIVTKK